MFTEKKSDFNKPGEVQGHHKGAQPVSLLCIIRTCSLLVDRSSMWWGLSEMDLTNNFFVVFMDKEDRPSTAKPCCSTSANSLIKCQIGHVTGMRPIRTRFLPSEQLISEQC